MTRAARNLLALTLFFVLAAVLVLVLDGLTSQLALIVFASPTLTRSPTSSPEPAAASTPSPSSTLPLPTLALESAAARITPIPSPIPQAGPRILVTSERANVVDVFDGEPPRFVTAIPVGLFPHNLSVSNDARYLGVDDRYSDQVSIVDTTALTEVVRIKVGRQPHDLSWAPDDSRIYVTQEKVPFISVIDTASWKALPPIELDSPTHDLTISPDGKQIWATTVRYRGLLIIDRVTGQIVDRLAYFPHGSHDAYFTPNGQEVWVTSSGFIESASQTDPNVVIFDAQTHRIKTILPLGVYPFHSVKQFRDGLFLPRNSRTIWFSDRGFGGVILVSLDTREIVTSIKTGRAPFHLSFGPNGLLYVANHDSATFSVVDPNTFQVLHTISTDADPHGIVVIARPPDGTTSQSIRPPIPGSSQ